MTFYEMIEDLSLALGREKLVVFVGAGVSKNSGLPTWGQIVQVFAKEIGYPTRGRLATEEYIRIPQYYYCLDESENHADYYSLIQSMIPEGIKPNLLDKLIVSLRPKHIVTTNFDTLLDQVAQGYEIIREDRDLLTGVSAHYLLKLHGDICQPEKLVFKEDDYLHYSHTHRLMETFLKSLLIDHVFLFVGYSLNDYNLKTFVSWIDYIAQEMQVKREMHRNYFLSSSDHAGKDYLRKYYEGKGLEVIDLYRLPPEVDARAKSVRLSEELGRKTYAVLDLLL
ncbi:hypothetical protein D3Z51_00300 [Clostridiaceae bacterium]|nr:hypothetical protein [Clostridiaceae bacterium]RKI16515.1 hypothetical protein D7V81_04610 [bacterium 1XD21-70]